MADEEHFSLCWNNFNANLSTGFHESLCRGDLVDVTLVAEGQMVKAHRLVLSVCSPLFRDMFNVMPSNQHAYVVLKDVSHSALQDLMTFVYCGEVNIKNEALSTFISTAESLQIKGLTDNDSPKSEMTEVMPTQIMLDPSPPPSAPAPTPTRIAPQRAIRQKPQRIEKMESEDSDGEERIPVLTKRQAAASKSTVAVKRMKTTPASSAVKRQQSTISVKPEPVLIDLPMEPLETAEETVEHEPIETEEHQESLIEEEQYSEIKYDDTTYFTETEDNKTAMTSFADQSAADVSASDAQDLISDRPAQRFIISRKGGIHLVVKQFVYRSNMKKSGKQKNIMYWECVRNRDIRCRARLKSIGDSLYETNRNIEHNHANDEDRIKKAEAKNLMVDRSLASM